MFTKVIFSSGKATHVEIYEEVSKGLEAKYPNHILPKHDRQWIFVNAGGWMASFYLLHASLTEYVYFMGTAMQTSGHAGMKQYVAMLYKFCICVLSIANGTHGQAYQLSLIFLEYSQFNKYLSQGLRVS